MCKQVTSSPEVNEISSGFHKMDSIMAGPLTGDIVDSAHTNWAALVVSSPPVLGQ